MKKGFIFFSLLIICGFLLSFINKATNNEIGLNAPIPMANEKFKDVSGKEISLNDIKTPKGLLVIFTSNVCTYVKLNEVRIKEVTDYCISQNVGCVLVNSNEEMRAEGESYEAMVAYSTSQKFSCYYAIDINSKIANAFGANATPQCFLFNNNGLIYKGEIDDNVKDPVSVKHKSLIDALNALIKGQVPPNQITKAIGCTIKRVE